jgi:hypothetical protein
LQPRSLAAQIRDVLRYQAIIHGRDETEVSCVGRLMEFLRDWESNQRAPSRFNQQVSFLASRYRFNGRTHAPQNAYRLNFKPSLEALKRP